MLTFGTDTAVRPEREADFDAIHQVIADAFGQPEEAELVRRLRATPEYLPELSLVAEVRTGIVGHIMLSRVTLRPSRQEGLALAPVSVTPDLQGLGVGTLLIEASINVAESYGESFIVLLGHADYYPRFGFEPALPHGIRAPWEVPSDNWMVRFLGGGDANDVAGTVQYSSAFD